MNNVMAFDLEIVKEIPAGKDWKDIRPLGISCAATMGYHDAKPIVWYHGMQDEIPLAGAMDDEELKAMLDYMLNAYGFDDVKMLTWNGLQFDFDVLAEESGMKDECVQLAMDHYDMMFQIFCVKGYPVGLDTIARGAKLSGKTEGMTGAKAPEMWAGTDEDRWKTLEYVADDVIATMQIYKALQNSRSIHWLSKKGNPQTILFNGWKTIAECLKISLPDNSWMTRPMTREQFYAWTT